MLWRKKTMEEVYEELDRESLRLGVAKDYDTLNRHASDNEYLYYLNHKVAFANQRLTEIKNAVHFQTAVIVVIAVLVFRKLSIWPF